MNERRCERCGKPAEKHRRKCGTCRYFLTMRYDRRPKATVCHNRNARSIPPEVIESRIRHYTAAAQREQPIPYVTNW